MVPGAQDRLPLGSVAPLELDAKCCGHIWIFRRKRFIAGIGFPTIVKNNGDSKKVKSFSS